MPSDRSSLPKLKIVRTGAGDLRRENLLDLPPLLHVHVPKCAGTTLDHIMIGLGRAYRRPAFRLLGTIYGQGFSGLEKKEAREQADGVVFPDHWLYASGHIPFGRFPPCEDIPNTVCFIRDPTARLISMFRMGVGRKAWAPTASLKEIFETGLLSANSMVRQLSGEISKDVALDSRHVDAAVRNFQSMNYTGRIENFDSVLGTILADYKVSYIAYHNYQVGEPVDDTRVRRLSAEAAPYVELDQVFFDRVNGPSRPTRASEEISLSELAPGTPVFLVSPYLVSANRQPGVSTFVVAEQLRPFAGT